MNCTQCGSTRIAHLTSKSDDRHFVRMGTHDHVGYLPHDLGIGGGDYAKINYCLNCGQIQGTWPLPETALERGEKDE